MPCSSKEEVQVKALNVGAVKHSLINTLVQRQLVRFFGIKKSSDSLISLPYPQLVLINETPMKSTPHNFNSRSDVFGDSLMTRVFFSAYYYNTQTGFAAHASSRYCQPPSDVNVGISQVHAANHLRTVRDTLKSEPVFLRMPTGLMLVYTLYKSCVLSGLTAEMVVYYIRQNIYETKIMRMKRRVFLAEECERVNISASECFVSFEQEAMKVWLFVSSSLFHFLSFFSLILHPRMHPCQ
jgi:hypothetical protein